MNDVLGFWGTRLTQPSLSGLLNPIRDRLAGVIEPIANRVLYILGIIRH